MRSPNNTISNRYSIMGFYDVVEVILILILASIISYLTAKYYVDKTIEIVETQNNNNNTEITTDDDEKDKKNKEDKEDKEDDDKLNFDELITDEKR